MKLEGNILQIKNKRDDANREIQVIVDRIEYLTYKKDGHFFQAFDYDVDLETPFVITGDLLARAEAQDFDQEEYVYHVYDLVAGEYVRNENKKLSLTLVYVKEIGETILNSGIYTLTVPNLEFEKIKKEGNKIKMKTLARSKKKR